jgi:hypothetical protein
MSDLQYERETTIVFNEEENEAMVWSASPSFQRRMRKLGVEPYKTAQRERGEQSCWYKVPKTWVKLSPPRHMVLSDEQRAAIGVRLRQRRLGANSNTESLPDEEKQAS